jgi:threonine/homoserine/homoserine lactone efflux protein
MIPLRLAEVLFLGFICGLIPGPVVAALFAETIRHGWKSSRRIVAWAAAGELVMSVACVALLTALDPHSVVFAWLSGLGALVLLHLSWGLWKVKALEGTATLFTNRRVFTLSILNGMAWIFWITVCVPQAVGLEAIVPGGRWLFILLFELGWVASTLSLCGLFGLFRPYFQNPRKLHLLYRIVSLLFVLFALKLALNFLNNEPKVH